MVTKCGGWSARKNRCRTSRLTAPKPCWWTSKKRRSRGVSGRPSRDAMRLSSPPAPDRGAGRIEGAEVLGRRGVIPRDDDARTYAEALEMPNTYRKTFEIIGDENPIR